VDGSRLAGNPKLESRLERRDNLLHVAKFCRACKKRRADRGGVCRACRRRILKDPVAPTLHTGVWKLAAVLVGLLSVTSALIGAAVVTHANLAWRHHLSLETRLPSTKPRVVAYETTMVVEQVTRKVYPYSIVPGGAENLNEAKRAMLDPAIKANYANIDLTKLKQVKLTTNLSGYVSYRWGEKIYWTSKAVTLRAGETVFTDGVHIVRGRCLNCYSQHAMSPTRAKEPTEQVMDTPTDFPVITYSFPKLPVTEQQLPPPPEELTPTVPVFQPTPPSTPGKPGGGFWFPIIPIIPPIHRHPGHPPVTPPPPIIGPPPTVVPEPHYGWLLLAGFFALILTHGWRRYSTARPSRERIGIGRVLATGEIGSAGTEGATAPETLR
jgi:hypothetical protein